MIMTTIRVLVIAAGALLTGCVERLTAVRCEPTDYTIAELRGDTVVTSTGLRWLDGAPGTGAALEWCQLTAVHYDAYLLDGSSFDTTREPEWPLIFTPGYSAIIAGLEQGVIGVRAGGTRRVIIPPGLGFGAIGQRDESGQLVVPPNSTLVYDIEVIEIAP
jgi:FKBP-type peptidyl-prolyl cis-trans isomerase FkpA